MPLTEQDSQKNYLIVETEDIKLISDYTGISFSELMELDCLTYKKLFKDALVFKMKQSQEGREYLENCWILTQTTPDREKLRNQFKKVGE